MQEYVQELKQKVDDYTQAIDELKVLEQRLKEVDTEYATVTATSEKTDFWSFEKASLVAQSAALATESTKLSGQITAKEGLQWGRKQFLSSFLENSEYSN